MERKQTTVSEAKIKEQVKNDKVKGLIHQILGVLLAFSAFAGVAGFGLDWLNEEFINSFGLLLYAIAGFAYTRSEEHTSELQSRFDLVCRLLLEKKKKATLMN